MDFADGFEAERGTESSVFVYDESDQDVAAEEETQDWRKLMVKIWESISQNDGLNLKSMVCRVPKFSSSASSSQIAERWS